MSRVNFVKDDQNYIEKLNDLAGQATGLPETIDQVVLLRDQCIDLRDQQQRLAIGDLTDKIGVVDQAVLATQVARDRTLEAEDMAVSARNQTGEDVNTIRDFRDEAVEANEQAQNALSGANSARDTAVQAKTDLTTARDQAVSANSNAQNARTETLQARDQAVSAAGDAATDAVSTVAQQTSLNASAAQEASASALESKNIATSAQASATASKNSASQSNTSAQEAKNAAQSAEAKAKTSETNAANSEATAGSHAGSANTSRLAAQAAQAQAEIAAASVTSPIFHAGDHNASGNVAPATPPSGKNPQYFITGAGTFGGDSYDVGDFTLWTGTQWRKKDNTDKVSSVNGQVGSINITRDTLNAAPKAGSIQDSIYLGSSVNLNSLTTPGHYFQSSNSRASTGSNYPVSKAGYLDVKETAGVIQTYVEFNDGHIWNRGFYNNAWTSWAQVYTEKRKPTPSEIGALGINATADNSAKLAGAVLDTSPTASSVVRRSTSGDINARLLRSTFGNESTISGGIAFRINNASNNFNRYCNNPEAIRDFIKVDKVYQNAATGTYPRQARFTRFNHWSGSRTITLDESTFLVGDQVVLNNLYGNLTLTVVTDQGAFFHAGVSLGNSIELTKQGTITLEKIDTNNWIIIVR